MTRAFMGGFWGGWHISPNAFLNTAQERLSMDRQQTSQQTRRRKKFFVVPGIQDMITAVIADRVGFDIVYGSAATG